MSLLDDINEDLAAERAKRDEESLARSSKPAPVAPTITWVANGYLARVLSSKCLSCSRDNWSLIGVFSEELGSNGTRRLAAASQFPQRRGQRLELVKGPDTAFCADCVVDLGFDEILEDPLLATNVVGEGITGRGRPYVFPQRTFPRES